MYGVRGRWDHFGSVPCVRLLLCSIIPPSRNEWPSLSSSVLMVKYIYEWCNKGKGGGEGMGEDVGDAGCRGKYKDKSAINTNPLRTAVTVWGPIT